jgi:transposase
MKKKRKTYTPEEKVAVLRRHVIAKVTVSTLCHELQLQPSVFYKWLKALFENGAVALRFQHSRGKRVRRNADIPPTDRCKDEDQKWMIAVIQGILGVDEVMQAIGHKVSREDVSTMVNCILRKPLKYRNRAVGILSYHRGIRVSHIAHFLGVSHSSVDSWIRRFTQQGCRSLFDPVAKEYRKLQDKEYQNAAFEILHSPPSEYGFNRTTWRQQDIHAVMSDRGLRIARTYISRIIKNAGYRYRKAKRVLTSVDPNYRAKLMEITRTLSNLGPKEKFFSIDEFGPFAIKVQGGRALALKGHTRTVPQFQTSKGSLIVTGALELSTNQVTHFYSSAKNTAEMVRLVRILVEQYADQERLYFSWDAASWHATNRLYSEVDELNRMAGKHPEVKLVPLPCCAQFLNVIESVFSGMARAVIHNSDYPSIDACKMAIDRHFQDRNRFFAKNPRRAGNKIWGKERVEARFSKANNCKDPRYR